MIHSADISWETVAFPWAAAVRLARELALPFPAAAVLAGRGHVEPDQARAFLDCSAVLPDPFLFGDMETVVRLIQRAIEGGRRIVIHGDYDADGITATAVLVSGLRAFGVTAEWYLPSRFREGFGLSTAAVESIAEQGSALLITVDCGVNYPDEVRLAKTMGLDVVVIDHHQPGPVLPECPLIHPVRGDYPSTDLCGVGLAFKVLHALHIRMRGASPDAVPDALHSLLDLVAVGTIADLAPLRGENRYFAREGLKLLTIGSRPGLRALSRVAGCSGAVDCGAVSFRIAPRLNAAGRLADASPPLQLLLTDDEQEAEGIAALLQEFNGARQDVERQILEQAQAACEALDPLPPLLVLAGEEWHEGVVGIVASRLVERYYRPVLLLGIRDGVAKGSGRSIPSYDLMSGLNACSQWLTVFGGHTQAVGLTLPACDFDGFREAIVEHARERLPERELRPVYRADAVLRGEDINADTALALAALGPFGSGNPRPRLLVVDATMRQVEVTRSGSHLRCSVEVDGVRARAIGFGLGERAEEIRNDGVRRILGVQLRVDEWQGSLRPELHLERVGGVTAHTAASLACGPECRIQQELAREEETAGGDSADRWSVDRGAAARQARGPAPAACKPAHSSTLVVPARSGRDLRGQPGRMAAMAQVLAGGEPVLVLSCSAAHCLEELSAALPLAELARGRLQCVGRGCIEGSAARLDPLGVTVAEWDVAALGQSFLRRTHAVALDPPYREEHVAFLRGLMAAGVQVHLYYGDEQRRATATLLKYLVHPRFAMVCVYRALKRGCTGRDLERAAADLAWLQGRVVLTADHVRRAGDVLAGLDLGSSGGGEAKIELDTIPAYVQAEADYEECSRLCRIL